MFHHIRKEVNRVLVTKWIRINHLTYLSCYKGAKYEWYLQVMSMNLTKHTG